MSKSLMKYQNCILFLLSLVSIISGNSNQGESNNATYLNWFKMCHHYSPLSWEAHYKLQHRPQSNYDVHFNYHNSYSYGHHYQQSKQNAHYGIPNPKPYYNNEQLSPLNEPTPNDFPNQNPSHYTSQYGGPFTHTYHQGFNGLPSHQRLHYKPYGNRQTEQPSISEENRFPAQNLQEQSNPTLHYNGQLNLLNTAGSSGFPPHHPYHTAYDNGQSERPSNLEQNRYPAQNRQENQNPTWQNNGPLNLPNISGFIGFPPHQYPHHTLYDNRPLKQPIIPEHNWFPEKNSQENSNPSWQNKGESNLPNAADVTSFLPHPQDTPYGNGPFERPTNLEQNSYPAQNPQENPNSTWQNKGLLNLRNATDVTSFLPLPDDTPYGNGPLEQPSIAEQNWFSAQNFQENSNTTGPNNGQSNLANPTNFTSNINGSNENINNRFQPTVESPIPAELLAPAPLTRSKQLDAFNISYIFGTDYNSNISIGPTGVQYDIDVDTYSNAYISSILCDQPYETPQMPDFSTEGRRISEIRCYEYIWQLKVRNDRDNWDRQCNNSNNNARRQRSISMAEGDVRYIGVSVGYPVYVYDMSFFVSTDGFAHMAALGWNGVNGDLVFKCGATLISANYLLTAAHCTSSAPDPTLSDLVPRIARIGGINIGFTSKQAFSDSRRNLVTSNNTDQVDVNIINIVVHEQYNPNRRYFDIALMQLEYSLKFSKNLQPACIWSDINTSKKIKTAVVAGWGVTNVKSIEQAKVLIAGELDIIDADTCDNLLSSSFGSKFDGVADHQLCAGKLSGAVDTCQGDSGGPLQVQIQLPFLTEEKMHTIVGVISAGVGCAIPNTPSLYTRVSSFIDWIEERVWS